MSILSSIGSFLSGAANTVYNTVSNIFGGTTGKSQSANALDFNNPLNNALQASGTPQKAVSNATTPVAPTSVDPYGTTYYNNAQPNNSAIKTTPVSPYSGLSGTVPTGTSFGANQPVNISKATQSGGITPVSSYPGLSGNVPIGTNFNDSSSTLSGVPLGLNTVGTYSFGGYGGLGTDTSSKSFSTNSTTGLAAQSFSAPQNVSISAGTLGSGTPSVLAPSSPSGTNYYGTVIAGNTAIGGNPQTGQLPITDVTGTGASGSNGQNPNDTTKSKSVKDRLQEVLGLYKAPENQASLYNKAVNESGLIQAQQQRQNTQNQINGITAQMHARLLQEEGQGRGIPLDVIGGRQAEITKEANIQLLPLQAQLAADQGNLELAQSNTTTLFKIYVDDAQNSVKLYNDNVKAAYDLFTDDEKKKAAELLWQKNYNADVVKADVQNQATIANELLKSGNVAGYKALTAIRPPTNMQSPTFAQDYTAYKKQLNEATSQFGEGVGSIERQLQKQQLTNAQLQGQKLSQEIAQGKPATGEYAPVIEGAASLVPAASKQGVKTNIANAIASGDFNTAYATVANSVANTLTGSAKTKFEDTMTDVGVMNGMKNAIQQYVSAGGDVGLLKGTADNISTKFGQLATDPKFAALGVQLQREFQAYRLGMTGAAFSPAESREYAAVNPRTNASLDLNLATIDGAVAQLTNRIQATVNARVPSAQKIYDLANPKQSTKTGGTLVTAPDGTQVIITD